MIFFKSNACRKKPLQDFIHKRFLQRTAGNAYTSSRNMRFSLTAAAICAAAAVLTMPACRAQIKNSDRISSETYILYGDATKYRRSEIRKMIREPLDYKSSNDLAVYLIKSGKIEKGAQVLHGIVKQSIKDSVPYLNLAKVLSIAGADDRVMETYDAMIKSGAADEARAYALAKKLYGENREIESYNLMHTLYRTSSASVKNKLQYGFWLARYHLEKGEYAGALNFFQELTALDEKNSETLFFTGYIYALGNDYVRSIEYLELARKFGYSEGILFYHLAKSYYGSQKYQDALRIISAIPETEKNFETFSLHGDILLKRNFSADLTPLLSGKKEKEKIQLLNHWLGTIYESKIIKETTARDAKSDTETHESQFSVSSDYILKMLKISQKEFLQLY